LECGGILPARAIDACGIAILSLSSTTFTCADIGPNPVTLTVEDENGNISTCTAVITVQDQVAPSILCPADVTVSTDAGLCTASGVLLGSPVTADNCGVDMVSNDAPSTFPVGNTTVTWTVTDVHGNSATCTQLVTVTDDEAPVADVLNLPTLTGECSVTDITAPTATDNCEGTITGTTTDPTSYTEQGYFTITWTYNDGNGNTSSQEQTVIVDDVNPPEYADCPSDISIQNDPGDCSGGTAYWTTPTPTDACGIFQNTIPTWMSGDFFPVGTTMIEYSAEDVNGNIGTCSFEVEVYMIDSDGDGVCDEFDLCPGGPEPGTPCDDGDPLTIDDVITPDCICAGTATYIDVSITVLLDGPYDNGSPVSVKKGYQVSGQ
jgi:hypothetical protein